MGSHACVFNYQLGNIKANCCLSVLDYSSVLYNLKLFCVDARSIHFLPYESLNMKSMPKPLRKFRTKIKQNKDNLRFLHFLFRVFAKKIVSALPLDLFKGLHELNEM